MCRRKLGNREGRVRYLRAGLIAAACLALPSTALATVTTAPNGHRLSVMLRHGIKGGPTAGKGSTGGAVLVSHGGPVLQGETPYLIFWTPTGHPIASSSEALLEQYLTDTATDSAAGSTDNVFSVLAQYGAPYGQSFSTANQAISDSNPYPAQQTGCTVAPGMTACVTDSSLQAEISRVITADKLPSGVSGSGSTPIFFMITPVDVNVCTGGNVCSSNNFCAYHSYFADNGQDVLYASVPFSVFANGNTKGCQTDGLTGYQTPVGSGGDEAYNVADDLSHEFSEMATDPLINAWYSKQGLEVADLCEAYGPTANTSKGLSPLAYSPAFGGGNGTLYDQIINGNEYYNQTEYSNKDGKCMTGETVIPKH